jgi:hypothetical protein
MRDECNYSIKINSNLEEAPNNICWADIFDYRSQTDGNIYIYRFREPNTEKHIPKLLSIINEITPCELVTIDGMEYIQYKLLPFYNQNLLILNFIRYLWYIPEEVDDAEVIQSTFFNKLYSDIYTDPISILTYSNKEACKNVFCSMSHSNLTEQQFIEIQTLESFRAYRWCNNQGVSQVKPFLRWKEKNYTTLHMAQI